MKGRKLIAPIVVTLLVLAYLGFYFVALVTALEGGVRILAGLIPVLVAGTMVYVCLQRIKEIRSGEEDDLGQY